MKSGIIAEPPKHAPLGARVASGFAWNFVGTLGAKILGFASQIILARLLVPDEFGAYAKAMIVVAFASLARDNGLPQILVHRQAQLPRLANAGFWMSLSLGVICGAAMFAVAPWASRFFGTELVGGILRLYGCASPILAVGNVPVAILTSQLRFKLLAGISAAAVVTATIVSIALAATGWGAYSLAWGMIAAGAFRTVAATWFAFPRLSFNPELRLWLSLAHDSGLFAMMALFHVIVMQADYLTLSRRFDDKIVGYYYFAFNLSMQAVTLLMVNLTGVLFPTLSRLTGEPQRQMDAYLRASRLLAIVAIPLCVMQAVLANPLITLVFGVRWAPSIPLFSALSIAAMFALMMGPSGSMLQAQGRFLLLSIWAAVCAVGFVVAVQIGAHVGAAMGVAVAVAFFYLVVSPAQIWMCVGRQASPVEILRMLGLPFFASALAAVGPLMIRATKPTWTGMSAPVPAQWLFLVASGIGMTAIYILVIRVMCREDFEDLVERLSPKVRSLFMRRGSFVTDVRQPGEA